MALTSEILLSNKIDLPTGYTAPVAAITLADPLSEGLIVTVASSGVINVTPATGFAALVAAVKTAIDTTDLLAMGIEYTVNNVDAVYTITKITRDFGVSQYSTTDNFIVNVNVKWDKV